MPSWPTCRRLAPLVLVGHVPQSCRGAARPRNQGKAPPDRSPHPRHSRPGLLPVRHRRPPPSSMPPVAARVAHTQVAGPVVRMIEVEGCALGDRPTTPRARSEAGSDQRLVFLPHRLMLGPVAARVRPLRSPAQPLLEARPMLQTVGRLRRPREAPTPLTRTLPTHRFTPLRSSRLFSSEFREVRPNVAKLDTRERNSRWRGVLGSRS
jgi:hypothetical protein